ncbi:diguanylate cyclase [Azospirillum sp.]|uniref:diguanylate cyclase n=1 Tax=Azospirillum sp. TaxID=34012 RepID=UPI002D426F13|nr:diguanylate cyclase [Azospirillum sp.]HYD67671.1 diguanylate cyclase [Azospirillum sp.]
MPSFAPVAIGLIVAAAGAALLMRRARRAARHRPPSQAPSQADVEAALRRRMRALAAIGRCGDILARDLPEAQVLAEVCTVIVDEAGYRMAWVGYADDAPGKPVRPMAHSGFAAGYVEGLGLSWDDTERGHTPVGTAIRTGQPMVVRDIHADPAFGPWREEAAQRGFASCIALPLRLDDHVIGALGVYAAQPDAFDAEEVALLGELAAKLTLGIARDRERAGRLRVEAALRASEQRYRRLFTQCKAVELLIDPVDGAIVDANQAAADFYGWPVEALKARRISDINCLTPDQIAAEMARARAESRSHFLFRHRLAGGEVRDVEVHSGPIEVDDRTLLYSIVHDITDRRRAERELRTFSSAIAQSTAAVIIADADARIEYVNPAFERLSGHTLAEVKGRTPAAFRSPNVSRDTYQPHIAAVRRGEGWRGEMLQRTKHGFDVWVSVAVSPVRDADGAITHFVALEEDISRRKQTERDLAGMAAALERSNRELERLAMMDALTGIANRRHFFAMAEREVALARRHQRPLGVLMLDIDHFKEINDHHGHAAGDEVLKQVARVALSVLRATDHIGRIGGEEFAVLLPDSDMDGAVATAERLREAIEGAALSIGADVHCTVSVGVAEWAPRDASIEAALNRADAALYRAKREGRNRMRCEA